MQYQTAKMATNPMHADMKPSLPSPEVSEQAVSSGDNTNSSNSRAATPNQELLSNGQEIEDKECVDQR